MKNLEKKYGFWTATAMVVGIVIGSGIFFKADDVLIASGGKLPVALLAWFIGGVIMMVTASVFAQIAKKVEKINGIVDYFEAAYGEKAGYVVAWFMSVIYYPTISCVLGWVSANYTVTLLKWEEGLWPLAVIYITLFFALNAFSPVLAGRWQVSATIIKLIPLGLVAIAGTIGGLVNGQTMDSFIRTAESVGEEGGLALATLSTAFAYEGWIIATTINAEIKDAKRNLPRALILGSLIVVIVYMLYYLGVSGVLSNDEIIARGDKTSVFVVTKLFGSVGGTLLSVFIIISCLGTLNGLTMGTSRGLFSIAMRKRGPVPGFFSQIHKASNSTLNSAAAGYILTLLWLFVWYGNFKGFWGGFLDISELPIAVLYTIYTALHIWVLRTYKHLNFFTRFIVPLTAIAGSLYIIIGALQKPLILPFLILTLIITGTGLLFIKKRITPQ